jgi:hypothetical protein
MLLQVPKSDTDCALPFREKRKNADTMVIIVRFIRDKDNRKSFIPMMDLDEKCKISYQGDPRMRR